MQEQNLPTPVSPESNSTPSVEVVPRKDFVEQAPTMPKSREIAPAAGDSVNQSGPAPQYSPVDLPQPIVVDSQDDTAPAAVQLNTPPVADDVDVIEKVWVEKAKSIVKQTKDDPYLQEQQVSILQDDYKSKRYSKESDNR